MKTLIKMKKENFSELATEELIKKRKITKMVTGMLGGVLTFLLVVAVFLAIKKGGIGISFIFLGLGLLPILFISYNSIKEIDIELRNRNVAI
ncbi:redox-active disulfide protein 2 [Hymenobacter lapidiphilus]|uniref:redox-active disulfide protein 2 n=1 Tax=Hymenobacter sp. CCM 8763 TaxID=2303334 RepID=UPI00167C6DC6|nr:redox-active disulfide protein 2 [Hymenobacter sp. CCM 8763]